MMRLILLCSLVAFSACFCAPSKAGDGCDLNAQDDPCPDGLVCQDFEGGGRCLIVVGNGCDPEAEKAFCADGSACSGAGEDAICGGRGAACSAATQCDDSVTCAELEGGGARCELKLVLRGTVIDGLDESPIEGANVIALDAQGTAITPVATSDAEGAYALDVPVKRKDDGTPADGSFVTLRASGQDYATFPGGVRTALPIDLDTAVEADGALVVEGAITTIALLPLPDDQTGRAAIRGSVAGDDRGGVLIVAEGGAAFSAVSDVDGGFVIFNVAPGEYSVRGYAAGLQLVPAAVTVADEDVVDVILEPAATPTGSVSGNVNFVNAPGGASTSVVLVVKATFDELLQRGEVPRGLRAPESGPPTIDGDFTITGVPDGTYVVLAAFENDVLVRDPDESIGGTELVSVTVPDGNVRDVEMPQSFKITEALELFSPGADGLEVVTAPPDFIFADDSSEEFYDITVFDAFGEVVWSLRIDGVSGEDRITVPYAGPALEDGMVYQFRVISGKIENDNSETPISATEDLKGVFQFSAQ